jgi:hypothetical protein
MGYFSQFERVDVRAGAVAALGRPFQFAPQRPLCFGFLDHFVPSRAIE